MEVRGVAGAICFAGVPLDRRDSFMSRKDPAFFAMVLRDPSTSFLLLHKGKVVCTGAFPAQRPRLWRLAELHTAGLVLDLPHGVKCDGNNTEEEQSSLVARRIIQRPACVTCLLGRTQASDMPSVLPSTTVNLDERCWILAAEASPCVGAQEQLIANLQKISDSLDLNLVSGRELYRFLENPADVALCGYAIASTAWQARARFCGMTGERTVSIECGTKRQTSLPRVEGARQSMRAPATPRWYPRIDPCVISLVLSPCGTRCLLSRPSRLRRNVFTCIAGFMEPCETVEEAVRREVWEESGIELDTVAMHSSQPWPVGRNGCELMLACRAVAVTGAAGIDITVRDIGSTGAEYASTDDIRWFNANEVRTMLQRSLQTKAAVGPVLQGDSDSHLTTPGPYAVAHVLLQDWIQDVDKRNIDGTHSQFAQTPSNWLSGFGAGIALGIGVSLGLGVVALQTVRKRRRS